MDKATASALVASDYAGRIDAPAAKQGRRRSVPPARQARHLAA